MDDPGSAPAEQAITRVNPFDKKRKNETFPAPPEGSPERELSEIPDERVAATMLTMQTAQLRGLLNQLSPRKIQFLKMRAVVDTDARAMHMMGHMRRESDPNYDRECECGVHLKHWIDMREATLWSWKNKDEVFAAAYKALISEPMIFSQAWMETLAVKTLAAYDELLGPDTPANTRRSAAKDMLEALDLKPTAGVQGSGKGEKTQDEFQLSIAVSRFQRGLPLSDSQRSLLESAGYRVGEQRKQLGTTTRTLDGRDVEIDQDQEDVIDPNATRGVSNEAYLPD